MSRLAPLKLLRWLGPWTPETQVPDGVLREVVQVPRAGRRGSPKEGETLTARVYKPAAGKAVGSLLLVQGLHYLGPDDPRMDRFASVLAKAGLYVLAPFLPDFAELKVRPSLITDVERAFCFLQKDEGRPEGKPGVFSISFGSLPALRLASSDEFRDEIGGLVIFGGYANFKEAIRFCLSGREGLPHDPVNRPVVFINLIEHFEGIQNAPELVGAFQEFVRRTWGRTEMRDRTRLIPVAEELASALPAESQELFLHGCDARPGGVERALAALELSGSSFDWLDPRPGLSRITCPTTIVHGRDDDVIPVTEAAALLQAMGPSVDPQLLLTGMYAHTGQTTLGAMLANIPNSAKEVRTMLRILGAFVSSATG